ncbi:uncharacterized protein LOC112683872 [Sipha flava]|uniref:Uncharacterized protein LOC112683872 n=1 Tax=Sipha flava TaxID=143950 RepID=A0A8B8FK26_9HEMI|nr:uncharacterized protein LOC112683872 [Sipha flava]
MEDRIFEPCVFKLLFQPIIQFRCFSFRYAKYKSIDRTMCEYNALYSVGYVEMRVTVSYYHNSQSPYKTVLEQVTLAFPNRNDWHLGQHRLKKWIPVPAADDSNVDDTRLTHGRRYETRVVCCIQSIQTQIQWEGAALGLRNWKYFKDHLNFRFIN